MNKYFKQVLSHIIRCILCIYLTTWSGCFILYLNTGFPSRLP